MTTRVPETPRRPSRYTAVSPRGKQLRVTTRRVRGQHAGRCAGRRERRAGERAGGRSRADAPPPVSPTSRARRALAPALREAPSTLANCGNSQVETRALPRHSRVTEAPERRDPGTRGPLNWGWGEGGSPNPGWSLTPAARPTRGHSTRSSGDPGWKGPQGAETRRARGAPQAGWAPGARRTRGGDGGGGESPDTPRPEGTAGDRRGGSGGYKPHALKRRAEVRPRSLTSPVHAAAHGCCRCDSYAEGYRAT